MTKHCIIIAFCVLVARTTAAFQYDAVTVRVLARGSDHVVTTRSEQKEYPLSEAHKLLERLARYSTNLTVVIDAPASLTGSDFVRLQEEFLSIGLHDQRVYLRSEEGTHRRLIVHRPKNDDLGSIVESEIWQEAIRNTLSESDVSLPPSPELKRLLLRSLPTMLLPFWAGGQDGVMFWIVLCAEILGLAIIILWVARRPAFKSNALWALPLAITTGIFMLFLLNLLVFWTRFGHIK